jgi:hypothetical protein
MHHMSLRQGLSSFSVRRRRTVSREMASCSVSLTVGRKDQLEAVTSKIWDQTRLLAEEE